MISTLEVYNTVLTILNKENRGYITPVEFTNMAIQAQLEIFEAYFAKHAAATSAGASNNTDYSDPVINIGEKIGYYDNTDILTDPTGNGNFSFSRTASTFYRFGNAYTEDGITIDEITNKDLRYVQLSPLTAPTETQPVFVRVEGGIQTYPGLSAISLDYLRRPTDPGIEGGAIVMGQQQFSNIVDFDLHPSEQIELVAKILSMAGVITRDGEVSGFGQGIEQKIQASE